jgi:ribosomal protein S18 acetylase RimI-like enzyme
MTFETAAAADVPALTDLLNEAYLPAEAFLYDGPRTTAEEVGARLAKGVFLLARSTQGLDGCVYVEPRGRRGYLGMLGVAPRRQGTGLGRELVHAGEALLRGRGVELLEIDVVSLRTELFGFYERLGFRTVGERPFADPRVKFPCHLVVMEKPLGTQDPSSRPPAWDASSA